MPRGVVEMAQRVTEQAGSFPSEFARIADAAPAPMWVTGPTGDRLFVNQAYAAFVGVTVAAALTFDWRAIIHPDDAARLVAESVAGEASGVQFALEARYRRADGAWRWLRSVSQPRFAPAGERIGFIGVAHDVTEARGAVAALRASEAALRNSERQLRLALDGAKLGLWDRDLVTGHGTWSERAQAIFGVPDPGALTAAERLAMVHPDDRRGVERGMARLAERGDDFGTEFRILPPGAGVRWVAMHGAILRDEAGTPVRAIGTMRDVTARREAQEEARRLNETLEQLVAERTAERDRMWRLSRDLLVVVGRDRRVKAVNPAIEALGHAADRIVGHRLSTFIHPDDRAAAARAIRAGARAPIGDFEARIRAANGDWRCYSWSAAPGEGEAYVIGRDITAESARRDELAQAQEQLRQAQKMESLGQLTGGVAHDFNNLLTPIIGSLDLLKRRGGDERQRRLVDAALEAAERARVLVQRLLAFARRQPLQPGPVDVGTLLDGLASLVASTVGPQVTVNCHAADDLPPALADANQLELALLNLVVNARDAMPDGGTLTVAALPVADPPDLPPGRYLALSVADTGVGMDPATLARAAEPFFSTKGVGRGTGLGLSMVHGLASQLGGAMRLDSRLGQGTRVALLLPVADAPAPTDLPEPAPMQAATGHVLLVDDEAPVREATAAMLAGLGFAVTTAASGADALSKLAADPDLLVTDHLMPGMTGAELAEAARAARPALKVLVISGYAGLDAIPPGLPRLAKPFRLDDLARSLAAL